MDEEDRRIEKYFGCFRDIQGSEFTRFDARLNQLTEDSPDRIAMSGQGLRAEIENPLRHLVDLRVLDQFLASPPMKFEEHRLDAGRG